MIQNSYVLDALCDMREDETRLASDYPSRVSVLITGKQSTKEAFLDALPPVEREVVRIRMDEKAFWLVKVAPEPARRTIRRLEWETAAESDAGDGVQLGPEIREEAQPHSGRPPATHQHLRPCRPTRWSSRE